MNNNDERRGWASLELLGKEPGKARHQEIIRLVEHAFEMTLKQIRSPRRDSRLITPRHILCFLLRRHTNLALASIGKIVGRDHSSVVHAVSHVEERIERSEKWREVVGRLEAEITK